MNQPQIIELLERAKILNIEVENKYLSLAWVLSEISENETYRAGGYESYADYVQQELQRSKTFASNLLLVGDFLRSNNYLPESVDTSYARLAQSIRSHKGESPELVLAAAVTNTESELISERDEKKAGEHECVAVCKSCKRLM